VAGPTRPPVPGRAGYRTPYTMIGKAYLTYITDTNISAAIQMCALPCLALPCPAYTMMVTSTVLVQYHSTVLYIIIETYFHHRETRTSRARAVPRRCFFLGLFFVSRLVFGLRIHNNLCLLTLARRCGGLDGWVGRVVEAAV
jgi:hypothetical protein